MRTFALPLTTWDICLDNLPILVYNHFMTETDWYGLYSGGWKDLIVPEAFSHPAKYSRKIIRKIYEHAFEEGWVSKGDWILDPFGGVGLGCLDSLQLGLNYCGIELEENFYNLGLKNIEYWANFLGVRGNVKWIHGDSRKVFVEKDGKLVVSSPPYSNLGLGFAKNGLLEDGENPYVRPYMSGGSEYGDAGGQLGNMPSTEDGRKLALGSPPYSHDNVAKNGPGIDLKKQFESYRASGGGMGYEAFVEQQKRHSHDYGDSDGQLGKMSSTEGGRKLALSSPPYADIPQSGGTKGLRKHGTGLTGDKSSFTEYGESEGQLGRMDASEDGRRLALSSPPYSNSMTDGGHLVWRNQGKIGAHKDSQGKDEIYGSSDGQLGNVGGNDFWVASRQIVDNVYNWLDSSAHAIWIVKAYVKNWEIVDFPEQWKEVCEAAGFRTVHQHRAWLIEPKGMQMNVFTGESEEQKIERKGFFKTLWEQKGLPKVDFEDVICMAKD